MIREVERLATIVVFTTLDAIREVRPDVFNDDVSARHARLTLTKSQKDVLFQFGQLWAEIVGLNPQEMHRSRFMLAAYGIPPKCIPNINRTEVEAGVRIFHIMNLLARPGGALSETALERCSSQVLGAVKMARRTGCLPQPD
jgi:hypothetical protein